MRLWLTWIAPALFVVLLAALTFLQHPPTNAALVVHTANPENFNAENRNPSSMKNRSLPTPPTASDLPTENYAAHSTAPVATASNGFRRIRMLSTWESRNAIPIEMELW